MVQSRARISLVTLGVADLEVAATFYEQLGWRRSSASVPGTVVFLAGGTVPLSLFGVASFAAEARVEADEVRHRGSVALAMNVPEPDDVAAVLAAAAEAGGQVTAAARRADWGGVSGYFADPDGHLWEVAHNPFFGLDADGRVELPA